MMKEVGFRGPLKAPSQSITQLALVHTGDLSLLQPRVKRGAVGRVSEEWFDDGQYGCTIIPTTSNAVLAEEDFQNMKENHNSKPQLDQHWTHLDAVHPVQLCAMANFF